MANLSVIIVFVVLLCAYSANSETTNISSSGSSINTTIEGSAENITSIVGDTNSHVNTGNTNLNNNINSTVNNINQTVDNSSKLLNQFYDNSSVVAISLHVSTYVTLALNIYFLIGNIREKKKLQKFAESRKYENA